ncbi:MAG: hypothetical protein K2P22_08230 [Lachnospiraceae bacterium]|nr:hypothetical protein [Lachnospiraceae bacterium]
MALRGYEVSAARYLAKPLQPNQLPEALLHCYKAFCEKREILPPDNFVNFAFIKYLRSHDLELVTSGNTKKVRFAAPRRRVGLSRFSSMIREK